MKYCRLIVLGLALSALFLLASCTMYMPMTQPSGSHLQLDMNKTDYTVLGVGEGTACASNFLGLPLGGKNTYQAAVNKAVGSKGGDLLIQSSADASMTFFPSTLWPLWQESCVTVQGLVIKLK